MHKSRAWAKALLILLALSVTTQGTHLAYDVWLLHSLLLQQQGTQVRDLVLRYWYSRARAARRAMYITTPLRGGATQRNKRDFHLLVDLKEHGFQLNFINLPLPLSGKKYTNESSINKTHTDIFVFLSGVKKKETYNFTHFKRWSQSKCAYIHTQMAAHQSIDSCLSLREGNLLCPRSCAPVAYK